MLDPTTIQVGDRVPSFSRLGTLQHWNRYAAVNDEFVDIHMDDESGRTAGYPSAFAMGNLQTAYLHNMLRDWVGEDGRIVRLGCQFRGAFTRNVTVTTYGVVTAVRYEDGETFVDLDVWTETDEGNRLAPGSATVAVPTTARSTP